MASLSKTKIALFGIFLLSSLFFTSVFSNSAMAHCPLCAAATGAAVVAARYYGVDDLIVSVLAGGFLMSTAYWFNNWLLKRNKGKNYLPWQLEILILATFLSTLYTFQLTGLLGNSMYQIYGLDKLVVGLAIGSFITVAAFSLHDFLRKMHQNKNYLPFQAIVLAFAFMGIAIAAFYFIGVIR
jgi:uncharacterized membrane protein (DUF4010 family)